MPMHMRTYQVYFLWKYVNPGRRSRDMCVCLFFFRPKCRQFIHQPTSTSSPDLLPIFEWNYFEQSCESGIGAKYINNFCIE